MDQYPERQKLPSHKQSEIDYLNSSIRPPPGNPQVEMIKTSMFKMIKYIKEGMVGSNGWMDRWTDRWTGG